MRRRSSRSGTRAPARDALGATAGALEFLRLLWEIHHALQAHSKRMAREIGLTGPQRLVLRMLGDKPGLTAGELATALHLDPSTITGIVDRLKRRGMVLRAKDPIDGRRFLLAATRSARATASRRAGTIEQRLEAALSSLSRDQVAAAHAALAEVAEKLGRAPSP